MSIERTKIFFISRVNCNWSYVIRRKQTEGQRLVKRNLTPEANPVSSGVAGACSYHKASFGVGRSKAASSRRTPKRAARAKDPELGACRAVVLRRRVECFLTMIGPYPSPMLAPHGSSA